MRKIGIAFLLGLSAASCAPRLAILPRPPRSILTDAPEFKLVSVISGNLIDIGGNGDVVYSSGRSYADFLVRQRVFPVSFSMLSSENVADKQPTFIRQGTSDIAVPSGTFLNTQGKAFEHLDRYPIRETVDSKEYDLEPLRTKSDKFRYYRSGSRIFYRPLKSRVINQITVPESVLLPLFKNDTFLFMKRDSSNLELTLVSPNQSKSTLSIPNMAMVKDFMDRDILLLEKGTRSYLWAKAHLVELKDGDGSCLVRFGGKIAVVGSYKMKSESNPFGTKVPCFWNDRGERISFLDLCPEFADYCEKNSATFNEVGILANEKGGIAVEVRNLHSEATSIESRTSTNQIFVFQAPSSFGAGREIQFHSK